MHAGFARLLRLLFISALRVDPWGAGGQLLGPQVLLDRGFDFQS